MKGSVFNDTKFHKDPFKDFGIIDSALQQTLPTLGNENPKDRLLSWHYRLGHLTFATLKEMARLKLIDPSAAKVEHPMCAGCSYGQQSHRAWQTKPNKSDAGDF